MSAHDVYQRALDGVDTQPGYRIAHPACKADACRQGRLPCPCPDACEEPEPGRFDRDARPLALLLASIVIVVLLVLLGVHCAARVAS